MASGIGSGSGGLTPEDVARRAPVATFLLFALPSLVLLVARSFARPSMFVSTRGISGAATLAGAVTIVLVAFVLRLVWRVGRPARIVTVSDWGLHVTVTLAVIASAICFTLASSSVTAFAVVARVGLWTTVVASEIANYLPEWRQAMTLVRRGTDSRGHKVEDDVGVARPIPVPAWTDPEAEGELATNVSQRWLRSTTSDGRDVIHATIRQPLVAGQQHAEVDIAFCPPFAGVPEVSLEVASDMDADVRATRVFSYGAHIEIKLDSPCEDDWEIVIQVFARR